MKIICVFGNQAKIIFILTLLFFVGSLFFFLRFYAAHIRLTIVKKKKKTNDKKGYLSISAFKPFY